MPERPSRASARIEQSADPADVRAVGYGPGDVPVVPEKYAGLPVHKEQSGRVGHWNTDLMNPEPSAVYVVDDRYLYTTDKAGRVTHAEGWLGWLPADQNDERRNVSAQREAGEPDRQRTDDGGHLFATVFDGPGESINLTAQSQEQNRARAGSNNWRAMEQTWQAMRASGIQVHAAIDVRHANSTTDRPSSRTVVDRHDGKHSPRRIFRETKPVSSRERA
ncbi:DNA/RNA non-specific endonuclease [Kribbella sp. VKM Ac-2566]|uniref:DNA/RNA non-specific endonuclease n=1 Tax=Kribbella sp. VKM Ac-2566 TaxID=2512218 RepID=UPI0010640D42|nr:DNA/RNA non-specific endonuclease [Kribbella sp. VKM Ac-2566]TDW92342.1 DNA/RNA non-specific endonuclease [Kribbella sp. VKM Ac-2566]